MSIADIFEKYCWHIFGLNGNTDQQYSLHYYKHIWVHSFNSLYNCTTLLWIRDVVPITNNDQLWIRASCSICHYLCGSFSSGATAVWFDSCIWQVHHVEGFNSHGLVQLRSLTVINTCRCWATTTLVHMTSLSSLIRHAVRRSVTDELSSATQQHSPCDQQEPIGLAIVIECCWSIATAINSTSSLLSLIVFLSILNSTWFYCSFVVL